MMKATSRGSRQAIPSYYKTNAGGPKSDGSITSGGEELIQVN